MRIRKGYRQVLKIVAGILIPTALYLSLKSVQGLFSLGNGEVSLPYFVLEILILILMSISLCMSLDHASFDFSLGAVAMLSPMLSLCIFSSFDVVGLFFCSIFFGCLLGFICGAVCAFSRLSPAWCSLCICLLYEGVAMLNFKAVAFSNENSVGSLRLFCSASVIILLFVRLIFKRTVFGYNYTAIARGMSVADEFGANIPLNRLIYHIISGGIMGGVGVMLFVREGQSIPSGLNFTSVRVLFFGLLPLFIGRLLSALVGQGIGIASGCVCAGMIYSFLRLWGVSENLTVIICANIILFLLIYLGNKHRILKKIRRQNIHFDKSEKNSEKISKSY